ARGGPGFERGEKRVLRQLLGQADVAREAREAGDDPGRLDAPDRVDGAMGVGCCHDRRRYNPQARYYFVSLCQRVGARRDLKIEARCWAKPLATTPRNRKALHDLNTVTWKDGEVRVIFKKLRCSLM